MTQQSLITRLKAVEEELGDINTFVPVFLEDVADDEPAMRALLKAELADLRELIKEAEGQEARCPRDATSYQYLLGEKP